MYTLSDTELNIERAVYNRIMDVGVDTGYIVDIRNSIQYPDTEIGWESLKNDQKDIILAKGYTVEVFNQSNSDEKGIKKLPRIVIANVSYSPGEMGLDPALIYEADGNGKFNGIQLPAMSSSCNFTVHCVAENVQQMRVLNSIIALALPNFGYIPRYLEPQYNFFVQKISTADISEMSQGIMERVHAFEIPDIYEVGQRTVVSGVSPITEVSVDMVVNPNIENPIIPTDENITVSQD